MIEWNLQARARACQACAKPFADKESYHTLLFDEKHRYERLDVCGGCWESQYSQGANDRKGFVSHWQGVFETPPAAPAEAIQKETAETLLRKLTEQNDPAHAAACYIIAVMLERKRTLKIKAQLQQDGQRIFVYEHARTGEVFTVPDPNLQMDRLEAVQRDVADLLEHGLKPSGGPANMVVEAPPAEPPAEPAEASPDGPVEPEAALAQTPTTA